MLHLQIKVCKIMGQRKERDREKRRSMCITGQCKESALTFNGLKLRPRWATDTRIGLRGGNLRGCVPSASHSRKPGQKPGKIGISEDCHKVKYDRPGECSPEKDFSGLHSPGRSYFTL